MSLPPQAQTLVDQLIQVLGLQACRPSGIRIVLDDHGSVQLVTPEIAYRAQKGVDRQRERRADLTRL